MTACKIEKVKCMPKYTISGLNIAGNISFFLALQNCVAFALSKMVYPMDVFSITRDLSGNSIGYVEPLSFSSLTSLQTLDISSNQLIFFPKLPNMTSLKSVDISHNKLQSIEHQAFDDFENSKVFKTL